MGQQRMKDLERKEEEKEKKDQEKDKESREDKSKEIRTRVPKKWKGKDWFAILSPKAFGENIIAETPATDPKTLVGRTIELSVGELMNMRGKDFQKMIFKVESVDGKNAKTRFNGYVCMKEFISRVVRKRLQKVEIIGYAKTKDEWLLQISAIAVMNRNVERNIQRKVRLWIGDTLKETVENSGIDELVKLVASGTVQHRMKKQGSKIYPVRFFEISKIEVIKIPEK